MISWLKSFRQHPDLPNALSVLRGILGCILPFLILADSFSVHLFASALFIFAALTDYWDGQLARAHGSVSAFGKIADPSMDKFLILGALTAFVIRGYFSAWLLVPIFFREVLVTFCRIGWMLEGHTLGAERMGKIKLVVQVSTVGFGLLRLLAEHHFPGLANVLAGLTILFLTASIFLTLFSGVTFLLANKELFGTASFAKFTSSCGVGLIKFIPGTWGSLLAVLFIPFLSWNGLLYLTVFIFIFWVAHWAVSRLDLTSQKDPGFVVIDEVLGVLVTFAGITIGWQSLVAGFFLFRFFDILKPFPLRRLERFPGFWGITLDDLGAGVYSWLVLKLIFHY